MNLRETTRDILSQVEQLTGFPVEVSEDRSLPTTAVVHMASRRTVPAHIVRTNPAAGQPPDYLICFQCGFILRLFADPPAERVECGYMMARYETAREMVQAHLQQWSWRQAAGSVEGVAVPRYQEDRRVPRV